MGSNGSRAYRRFVDITVGIVASLPQTASSLINSVTSGSQKWELLGFQLPFSRGAFLYTLLISAIVIAVTVFVVKLNEASRKITVHYAKRVQGNRTYGGVTTILPVKLITAGVIPIIFAVAFLSVPSFAGQLMVGTASERLQDIGTNLLRLFQTPSVQTFQQGGWQPYLYPLVYFLLVVIFTFFYTSIAFNAKEIAENLQKQGGFISGVRSGQQTEKFLSKVVNRLTLFGSISLGILALI